MLTFIQLSLYNDETMNYIHVSVLRQQDNLHQCH